MKKLAFVILLLSGCGSAPVASRAPSGARCVTDASLCPAGCRSDSSGAACSIDGHPATACYCTGR